MHRYILHLLFMLLAIQCSGTIQIKRKGSLGIGFYPKSPDSLVQKLAYKQGAIVQFVIPNTTAASIGVQTNDIITRINDMQIAAPNDIFKAAKTLREQDKIDVQVLRQGKTVKLNGNVIAKPKETSQTAAVTYGAFAYKDGYVRTIYKAPKGKKPLGTVYFLQGLSCYSVDNFKDLDKTKLAIDAMVDRGFAVYRMEKGDMGDNINTPPCETMGFNEELDMYRAGYENLCSLRA